MSNTNFVGGVVKILEIPNQKTLNNTLSVTQFRAKFPQNVKWTMQFWRAWGNWAHDVATYYKINDYILIEGYLSFKDKTSMDSIGRTMKKLEITVLKVYPFLLNYDRSISSLV